MDGDDASSEVRREGDGAGLAQSTVSKHLSFLLECRLVSVRPSGRSSWYSLSEPAAISALIGAAEELLDATGTRAELCAHLRGLGEKRREEMETL
ncbi:MULTISPECIES: ArsR/SmtB family transcription factor [Microbacterium]|uniref:ArsR family transcriptional regulator n=1 Tax=Microbacterium profundi TaxID=450380 RepID=A0ABV3LDX6_9MICO|nr:MULTISPECIES: ArsR family transcriptional regulator [Microbacterium]